MSGSVSGYLTVWDVHSGQQLSRVKSGQGAVQDIAISPDGALLVSAGDSRTVKLWDAATLTELAELRGHTAPIHALAFSRDGRTLASAGDDHSIIVWAVADRSAVADLTGHTARIRGLAFTPDGTLLSGGDDGRIIRWSLDPAAAIGAICARAGRDLTRQEWDIHLPSVQRGAGCGGPAADLR
jgi:WD40 repeat protein